MTKEAIERLIAEMGSPLNPNAGTHYILIGDVLEKMKALNILYYTKHSECHGSCCDEFVDNESDLLDYWGKCGFSRSLQRIYADCEWEDTIDPCCGDNEGHGHTHIKQQSHRDLFKFLLSFTLIT